jgi:hypothetical protein
LVGGGERKYRNQAGDQDCDSHSANLRHYISPPETQDAIIHKVE